MLHVAPGIGLYYWSNPQMLTPIPESQAQFHFIPHCNSHTGGHIYYCDVHLKCTLLRLECQQTECFMLFSLQIRQKVQW